MRILTTICARKGSKRFQNKNIRDLLGKPLIGYTIETAIEWGRADKIIVSTDSKKIARISREFGADVPFMRPSELASDFAAKLPVIKHAVDYLEKIENESFDLIVDLDPTSPLRTVDDVENAYNIMVREKPINLFSVTAARKNPYFNMVELDEQGHAYLSKTPKAPLYRMQDSPLVYEMNASIYMYWKQYLNNMDTPIYKNSIIYEMPYDRSIDIDSEFDFKMVEWLMRNKSKS